MNSVLKWAGAKKKLIKDIERRLPSKGKKRLVEPFLGGGSVFLNLDFDEYLLVDVNQDLINLYNAIKEDHLSFINDAKEFFQDQYNVSDKYYELRQAFNESSDPYYRSLLFLYLNKHGFNGLCRYNLKNIYNVPFGRYKQPYFPLEEIKFFADRAKRAQFLQGDYGLAFSLNQKGDVNYCDPPYIGINATSNFTSYAGNKFDESEQLRLIECAENARTQGIPTLISNHDLAFTRKIYSNANKISSLKVQRSISCKGKSRVKVKELMALYR